MSQPNLDPSAPTAMPPAMAGLMIGGVFDAWCYGLATALSIGQRATEFAASVAAAQLAWARMSADNLGAALSVGAAAVPMVTPAPSAADETPRIIAVPDVGVVESESVPEPPR